MKGTVTLSMTTVSIRTLSPMTFSMKIKNAALSIMPLSAKTFNAYDYC